MSENPKIKIRIRGKRKGVVVDVVTRVGEIHDLPEFDGQHGMVLDVIARLFEGGDITNLSVEVVPESETPSKG